MHHRSAKSGFAVGGVASANFATNRSTSQMPWLYAVVESSQTPLFLKTVEIQVTLDNADFNGFNAWPRCVSMRSWPLALPARDSAAAFERTDERKASIGIQYHVPVHCEIVGDYAHALPSGITKQSGLNGRNSGSGLQLLVPVLSNWDRSINSVQSSRHSSMKGNM